MKRLVRKLAVVWLCAVPALVGGPIRAGEPAKPDPNPPSDVKVKQVKWPGVVSIFCGHNWGNDENYLIAIKECGFGAAGAAEGQIEQCRKQGLKAYVFLWQHEAGTVPAKYKNDDTVLCYYLSDRINPSKWGHWAGLEKIAYQADPHHPAVFTMYALYGASDRFLPVVRARVMEYYQYHWDANRGPAAYFFFLEQYRQASAKAGGVPICQIAETRADDVRKTRQTVYTSLAYGVRGIRTGGRGLFDAARDSRGVPKRTIHGEEALRFNQAIKAYCPVFEKARSVNVFHTAPLPAGTKEAPADHWVRPNGKDIVMGEFADADKNRFLMLANRDAFAAHEATLRFSEKGLRIQQMDKVSGQWKAVATEAADQGTAVKVPLEEGGGELLQVLGPEGK
jgi:hypothetical protein